MSNIKKMEGFMFERMLDKQVTPTIENMIAYCDDKGELFKTLNAYLTEVCKTQQEIRFPYGKHYGWSVTHRKSKKLICDIFPEAGSFTIMLRLTYKQLEMVYNRVSEYTQKYIDNKYPCSDGGWIHYRILYEEHLIDGQELLSIKCS